MARRPTELSEPGPYVGKLKAQSSSIRYPSRLANRLGSTFVMDLASISWPAHVPLRLWWTCGVDVGQRGIDVLQREWR